MLNLRLSRGSTARQQSFQTRQWHRKDWEPQDKRFGACSYRQKFTRAFVEAKRKKHCYATFVTLRPALSFYAACVGPLLLQCIYVKCRCIVAPKLFALKIQYCIYNLFALPHKSHPRATCDPHVRVRTTMI